MTRERFIELAREAGMHDVPELILDNFMAALKERGWFLEETKRLYAERDRMRRALNFIVNNASSWGLEAEEYVTRAREALQGGESEERNTK